ncbi:hypothetical protein [Achromobacter sp. ESBL13]
MKRILAVLLLMFGGFSAEAAKPFQCQLISNTRPGGTPVPPVGRGGRRLG